MDSGLLGTQLLEGGREDGDGIDRVRRVVISKYEGYAEGRASWGKDGVRRFRDTRYLYERQRGEPASMTCRLVIGAGVRGGRDGPYIMRHWRGVTVQDEGGGGEVR